MKIIRSLQALVCVSMITLWGFLLFGFFAVPNQIVTVADAVPTHSGMFSIADAVKQTDAAKENADAESYAITVKFLGTFPVKNSVMTVNPRAYVNASGQIFGLRMYTSGVVIVSTDQVETPQGSVSPAERAGLKKGDIILSVNDTPVNSHTELSAELSDFSGSPVTVTYERAGERRTTTFAPAYSTVKERYMAGMWVRDSAAGIGTMTFYDPQTGVFAGLGHAVCDADTGEALPLYNGDIVEARITGCLRGGVGRAGELCGAFQTQSLGTLVCNDPDGVYGFMAGRAAQGVRLPVATAAEVKTGAAKLLATVDESGPQYYDAEIEKVSPGDDQFRNMIVRVTDARLLQATGGIVQGMSGSPVVQNDKLVGAITHVFVNEPQRGYAIFSEYMMEKAKLIAQTAEKAAS